MNNIRRGGTRPTCLLQACTVPGNNNNNNNNNNNSIQCFIIYVSSQQLQGQLQTQHSVDTTTIIILQCQNSSIKMF
jgi:hypothetical protein